MYLIGSRVAGLDKCSVQVCCPLYAPDWSFRVEALQVLPCVVWSATVVDLTAVGDKGYAYCGGQCKMGSRT